MLEDHIKGVIDRGVEIISISIGYGPSPAKAAGLIHGEDSWCAMLIVDSRKRRGD